MRARSSIRTGNWAAIGSSPLATRPADHSAWALLAAPVALPAGVLSDASNPRKRTYLGAVYGVVSWWSAEGREIDRARRALRLGRLEISDREHAFAATIRCAAQPAKADKRIRSKWSRLMRYAAVYKSDSEALGQFIQRKRGINACAARFTRCLGRYKANRSQRRSAGEW
jgi:hypothetical protein